MPIYAYQCRSCQHEEEHFLHSFEKAQQTFYHCLCGTVMKRIIGQSAPALWFEEGRGRWIQNLSDKPEYVTSKAQLRQLEKKHGVVNASTDDLLYNKTRRALDARRESPHSLKDAFRKAVESL